MRNPASSDSSLFEFLVIDSAEVERFPHAIRAMYDKQLDGMIVRNVLPRETVEAVCARLAADNTITRNPFPMFAHLAEPPHVVGNAIVAASGGMEGYFREASAFREQCRALFDGHLDFEQRVESVFRALSGGLHTEIASGPVPGSTYTPATIRVLPEGHEMGIHVGNEFLRQPQSRHLREIVDMSDQLSFFIPLTVPEGGGELVVYGLEWDDVSAFLPDQTGPDEANVHLEGSPVWDAVSEMDSTAFAPAPGDMLIFDGGRYYHRVSKVQGSRARRTIGGFLGYSQAHDRILYWS